MSSPLQPALKISFAPGSYRLSKETDSSRVDDIEILGHFLSDFSATRQTLDTYRRWSIRCGPIRVLYEYIEEILEWSNPEMNVLCMLLIWIFCMNPSVVIAFSIPAVLALILYSRVLFKCGILNSHKLRMEDIGLNLEYNRRALNTWCHLYDSLSIISATDLLEKLVLFAVIALFSLLTPLEYYIPIVANAFIISRLPELRNAHRSNLKSLAESALTETLSYEIYENQRWWVGSWTDKGLTIGTTQIFPWSDASGNQVWKSSFKCPDESWHWEGLWHPDERGWEYATNFDDTSMPFHPEQLPSDFVRRRRWVRYCSKLE